jgi:hypothetical protein
MDPCDLPLDKCATSIGSRFEGAIKTMAKQRIVNTRFWDDTYIAGLASTEKLLFLYLLTNPLTNISGVYELPSRRVAFDTGVSPDEVEAALRKLEADGKIVIAEGWVGIVNFIKHQALNPKIKQGILTELKRAPKSITDRLSIDYQALGIGSPSLPDSNPNLNTNPNSNRSFPSELSTVDSQDLQRRRRELISKWRV